MKRVTIASFDFHNVETDKYVLSGNKQIRKTKI